MFTIDEDKEDRQDSRNRFLIIATLGVLLVVTLILFLQQLHWTLPRWVLGLFVVVFYLGCTLAILVSVNNLGKWKNKVVFLAILLMFFGGVITGLASFKILSTQSHHSYIEDKHSDPYARRQRIVELLEGQVSDLKEAGDRFEVARQKAQAIMPEDR